MDQSSAAASLATLFVEHQIPTDNDLGRAQKPFKGSSQIFLWLNQQACFVRIRI